MDDEFDIYEELELDLVPTTVKVLGGHEDETGDSEGGSQGEGDAEGEKGAAKPAAKKAAATIPLASIGKPQV